MTTYTKATKIKFQSTVDLLDTTFLNGWFTKIVELTQQGKTDGTYEFLDEHTAIRYWLDQAAADEWVQAAQAMADAAGVPITSIEIIDSTYTA